MRFPVLGLLLAIAILPVTGCRSTPLPAGADSTPIPDDWHGRSLAEMQADYAAMHERYVAHCLSGTPEQIRISRAACTQEHNHMAPYGNALAELEVRAAAQATKH